MERAPDKEGGCFLLGTGLQGLGHGEWYLVKKEEGAAGGVLGGGSFLQREGVPVLGEGTKRKGVWLVTSLNEGDGVIGR